MRQFFTVLKFEMENYFKNKSFIITTILLVLASVLVIAIPPLIPGLLNNKQEESASVSFETAEDEKAGQNTSGKDVLGLVNCQWEQSDAEKVMAEFPGDWKIYSSEKELEDAVSAREITAGFILRDANKITYVVWNHSVMDWMESAFTEAAAKVQKEKMLSQKGMTQDEILALEQTAVISNTRILGKNSAGNYLYTYILVFVLYLIILIYGQMIAVSVTTEKSNRAIEILVTSVNSNSLIFGKVLAGALSSIIQIGILLGASLTTYHVSRDAWGNALDMILKVPGNVLAAYAVFGLLGYLLYALIFGALGALVSKTEDISKSSSAVTLIYVAAFLIAIMGMNNSDSMLVKVTSFIPFTAHNSMFIRIAMGSVHWWEITLSLLILGGSCAGMGLLAAKLFRFGTLRYGNPIKFRTALKSLKQGK